MRAFTCITVYLDNLSPKDCESRDKWVIEFDQINKNLEFCGLTSTNTFEGIVDSCKSAVSFAVDLAKKHGYPIFVKRSSDGFERYYYE